MCVEKATGQRARGQTAIKTGYITDVNRWCAKDSGL
jgi:hypothetical protein